MLYLDDVRVDLKGIEKYSGTDSVMIQLREAANRVKEHGMPIRMKCDALHTGKKEGKKGIWIPYIGEVHTNSGTSMLVYANSARSDKGGVGVNYRPRGIDFTKTMVFNDTDIDKLLFFMVGCPLYKTGALYIEDLEEKAKSIAKARAASSTITFYLYNESSPIYGDEKKLMQIASALGITTPEDRGLNELRNTIFDRVEASEKINDAAYGYKWFARAVQEFDSSMEALMHIQRAVDKKIIAFNKNTFKWMLLDEAGNNLRILCPVEPHKASMQREILAALALRDSEVMDMLKASYKTKVKEEMGDFDVDIERAPSAGDDGNKLDFATMDWNDMKALAKRNNILTFGKKKPEIIAELEHKREALV